MIVKSDLQTFRLRVSWVWDFVLKLDLLRCWNIFFSPSTSSSTPPTAALQVELELVVVVLGNCRKHLSVIVSMFLVVKSPVWSLSHALPSPPPITSLSLHRLICPGVLPGLICSPLSLLSLLSLLSSSRVGVSMPKSVSLVSTPQSVQAPPASVQALVSVPLSPAALFTAVLVVVGLYLFWQNEGCISLGLENSRRPRNEWLGRSGLRGRVAGAGRGWNLGEGLEEGWDWRVDVGGIVELSDVDSAEDGRGWILSDGLEDWGLNGSTAWPLDWRFTGGVVSRDFNWAGEGGAGRSPGKIDDWFCIELAQVDGATSCLA